MDDPSAPARRPTSEVAAQVAVGGVRLVASLALFLYALGVPILVVFLALVGAAFEDVESPVAGSSWARTLLLVGLFALAALPVALIPVLDTPPPAPVWVVLLVLAATAAAGCGWVWLANPLEGDFVPWVAAAASAGALVALAWLTTTLRPRRPTEHQAM